MTSRERIRAVLEFKKPDRLPVIEWAPYWDLTVKRWHSEGLPASVDAPADIRDYFELDTMLDLWVRPRAANCPVPEHGKPLVTGEKDYDELLSYLYPDPAVDPSELERLAKGQQEGAAMWCWTESFFWHPRILFGIEEHLYAFFDQPELMNRMNEDLLEFLERMIEQVNSYLSLQFIALGEDMSYNHGPMISKATFDEFNAPFYRKIVPFIQSKGTKVFVDSDGLVDDPVDWYKEVGCDGFLPLEKLAGVDVVKYRRKHPDLLMMGAFDKICMNKGEAAMRAEFERLLPVMRQSGYIPGVDHQTPPEVSIEDYRLYISLMREYCQEAVH